MRGHSTFESYCQERWGFNRHRASQLISASEVVTNVTSLGSAAPATESHARELVGLEPEIAAPAGTVDELGQVFELDPLDCADVK